MGRRDAGWDRDFHRKCGIFEPLTAALSDFHGFDEWPTLAHYNRFLQPQPLTGCGVPVTFVPQPPARRKRRTSEFMAGDGDDHRPHPGALWGPVSSSPLASLYEVRIFLEGEVATREKNWHDFFHMLVWRTFPKSKAAINRRHFLAFDERTNLPWRSLPAKRTPEQDALTVFDEGGLIMARYGDRCRPFAFGHALYEAAVYADAPISAASIDIPVPLSFFEESLAANLALVDDLMARLLGSRARFASCEEFRSTPIFELPGWHLEIPKAALR